MINYTVQRGDSIYTIANKFKVSVDDIKRFNKLNNNLLKVGQILIIKKDEEKHIGSDICDMYEEYDKLNDLNYDKYVVKKGDTLDNIAKKYDTTIANLIYINDLKNNLLSVDQILYVPNKQSITYKVKEGDNLYSIASNYNTTVNKLMKSNNLMNTSLEVGQLLKIPNTSQNREIVLYQIRPGDKLLFDSDNRCWQYPVYINQFMIR